MSRRAEFGLCVALVGCMVLVVARMATGRFTGAASLHRSVPFQAPSKSASPALSPLSSVVSEPADPPRVPVTRGVAEERATQPPRALYPVEGTVRDDAGQAVPGCEVVLRAEDGGGRVFADSSGRFRFAPVSTKDVELFVANSSTRKVVSTLETHRAARAEKPGWGALRVDLSLAEPVVITLLRASFLKGRFVDSNWSPLEGVSVDTEHELRGRGRVEGSVRTDESGRFSLRVLPGRSSLSLQGSVGGKSAAKTLRGLELLPGEVRDLGDLQPETRIDVQAAELTLSGFLVDSAGKSGSGIELVLTDSEGIVCAWATTRIQGRFRFEDLVPGDYRILLAEEPYGSFAKSVSVTDEGGSVRLGEVRVNHE